MNAARHPNYPNQDLQHGTSPCGWWIIAREVFDLNPALMRTAPQYLVTVGTPQIKDCDERWTHNFHAVVDDFGTLRRVPTC